MPVGDRETLLADLRIVKGAIDKARQDDHPKIALSYPRTGVWTHDNQLGYETPFAPDSTYFQTILKLDEWEFPAVWTVSLGVRFEAPLVAGQIFDATGIIDFGSGGAQQSFEVDWVDGTMFCLPMNFLNVRAKWNDLAAFFGFPVPEGVKLSVLLSRGSSRHVRATRTIFFDAADDSTWPPPLIANQQVPLFAKSGSVLPLTSTDSGNVYGAGFEIHYKANSDPAAPDVATIAGNFLDPTLSTRFAVPAFAHYYRITNTSGAEVKGSIVWNLFDV